MDGKDRTDEENEQAVFALLKEAGRVNFESSASATIAQVLAPEITAAEWGRLSFQIDNLPMPILRALAEGAMPAKQANITLPDTSLIPGSPQKNMDEIVRAFAQEAYELHQQVEQRVYEENVRTGERRHEWRIRLVFGIGGFLSGVLITLIGAVAVILSGK